MNVTGEWSAKASNKGSVLDDDGSGSTRTRPLHSLPVFEIAQQMPNAPVELYLHPSRYYCLLDAPSLETQRDIRRFTYIDNYKRVQWGENC